MNFTLKKTKIEGCCEVLPIIREDNRGCFIKIFHTEEFEKMGLAGVFREEYYSVSKKGVLRGLHFQAPPKAISKLVYCVEGEICDAVLDLRRQSPTYGVSLCFTLSSKNANMLYVPAGCAHGFYALSERVVMLYHTTEVYSPQHDAGILWNSAGIQWPCADPIISARDMAFPAFKDFVSPF